MVLNDRRVSRIVAVANGKGGVGKTTLSTNLAGLHASTGRRTLLIEFDPQGDCGLDLGYGYDDLGDRGAHMLSALRHGHPLRAVLRDVRPNLDVIPMGRTALMEIDDLLRSAIERGKPFRHLLADALAPVAEAYDLVVVDTPPFAPVVLQLVLSAARWLVIPTRGDNASLLGLRQLAAEIEEARPSNPDLELLGIVLFDMDTSATRIRRESEMSVGQLLGTTSDRLLGRAIRHSAAAVDARAHGCLVHELAQLALDERPLLFEALRAGVTIPRIPSSVVQLEQDLRDVTRTLVARMAAAEPALVGATVGSSA
jgi:cellulose biosynthesis protein BcsQ